MSERLNPIEAPRELPTDAELLRALVERQGKIIHELRERETKLIASNHQLAAESFAASGERLKVLKMLQAEVTRLKGETMIVVTQRDEVEKMLRELLSVLADAHAQEDVDGIPQYVWDVAVRGEKMLIRIDMAKLVR